jgi:hypothetical protein
MYSLEKFNNEDFIGLLKEKTEAKIDNRVAPLEEKVNTLMAKNGKLSVGFSDPNMSNTMYLQKDAFDLVGQAYSDIKEGRSFVTKSVGTMLLSNNLTGTSQVSYTGNPIMRSFTNPHLYDIFSITPTATGNVTFPRGNSPVGEGSFGTQTEGSAKAQVDYDVTMVNVNVPFVAGYTKVSRQMLQDLPFLQAYLSKSLIEDWNQKVDNSFMTTITISATPGSTVATPIAERVVDYLAQHGALGLGDANLVLTTHAVWASILKTLPTNGGYSVPGGVTIDGNGTVRVAGVPLVPHRQVPTGKIYVMNTNAFTIAQASGLTIRSTESDQDDFIKNIVAYRCEARVELLSYQPTAAIYGSAS